MQKRFAPDEGGVFPEWEEVRLGDIVELKNGYAFSAKTYDKKHDGKYNILTIANVQSEKFVKIDNKTNTISELPKNIREHQKLKDGDLLISLTGNVGRVAINKGQNNLLNQRVGKLEIKDAEKVDSTFLYYVLNSDLFLKSMKCKGHGTAQKNLSKPDIEEFLFYMPCIEEQRKIAAALAAYDEMIAVKTAKLETWQECKKRMIKEIFGRTKRVKNDDGNEFPEWEEKALGEVAEILKNNVNPQDNKNDSFTEYSMPAYDNEQTAEVRLGAAMKSSRKKMTKPVVLVNKLNVRKKRVWKVSNPESNAVCSAEFVPLASDDMDLDFLQQLCETDDFTKYLIKNTTGTANSLQRVRPGVITNYTFKMPCMKEQQKIGSLLAEIDKEIQIQKEFIKTYAEGKKRMMMELMEKCN